MDADATNRFITDIIELGDGYDGADLADLQTRVFRIADAYGFEPSDYLGELARRIHHGHRGYLIFDL